MNKLAQSVTSAITPVVGEFVAKATVLKNCELLGISPEALCIEELPQLAKKIQTSISFFAGTAAAEQAYTHTLAASS